MTAPITILLIAIFLFGLCSGAVAWFVLRSRRSVRSKTPLEATTPVKTLPFHWNYIILPVAILLLSIILVVFFYPRLPQELVYPFKLSGSPDRWLRRETTTILMLALQLILTLLAVAITLGIPRLGLLSRNTDVVRAMVERVLAVMGNMIALPQLVLCFAMLSIFSYNSYGILIMPLWAFGLIVMTLGGVILGLFFISTLQRARKSYLMGPPKQG